VNALLAASASLAIFWRITAMSMALIFGFLAVYWLLPRPRAMQHTLGGMAAALALGLLLASMVRAEVVDAEAVLFYIFALLTLLSGGSLITQKDPVRGALSFALTVLGTCGLFLLQGAPFLMAATTIIYAGAIIVTFIFVIMLAHQHGPSNADSRSREPFLATLAGFLLLTALLVATSAIVNPRYVTEGADPFAFHRYGVSEYSQIKGASLELPGLPAENVAYLGRMLFTDYLLAVEMAGLLLLTATIGAILVATRRAEGKR
jgi:NADH-quinone oxidoreductase subunit J